MTEQKEYSSRFAYRATVPPREFPYYARKASTFDTGLIWWDMQHNLNSLRTRTVVLAQQCEQTLAVHRDDFDLPQQRHLLHLHERLQGIVRQIRDAEQVVQRGMRRKNNTARPEHRSAPAEPAEVSA